MRGRHTLPAAGLAILAAAALTGRAQNQYIGYVYPAGGQQDTTFPIRLGGQSLTDVCGVIVTGEGVTARLVEYYGVFNNQELGLLNQQLNELKKQETTVNDSIVARMTAIELPAPIGPDASPNAVPTLLCPACGKANAIDAEVCESCNVKLEKPKTPAPGAPSAPAATNASPEAVAREAAKQKMLDLIQRRFAEDERDPAVRSQTEIVFAEITIDPDAKPGRREIRVVTKKGVSNPLPFYVDQVPEVARKPMKTMKLPVLGKEHLAQRIRPPEEAEIRVTLPCTMNGQIAAGEINRYRFEAAKGQRLLISVRARELVPYVPDGVPGWLQAVLRLCDANGNEMAYSDDFRSNPDPVIFFEAPEDGEYLLTIHEALFRGRESFTYRITVGELPYVTDIFPLGGRAGTPANIEISGWKLETATMAAPPADAKPGRYMLAATDGEFVSNYVPFMLDTLPECMDQEPNDDPASAQNITLPVVINGRSDRPGDWDVFKIDGKAGETIVAEVHARRLGSPLDSFVKVTGADGRVLALNDDYYDAASGLNTDHADSYLMVQLPADGTYHVHLGDTRRQAGPEFAYRLRISAPRPDIELRVIPSRICIPAKGSANVTVFAIRRDGFDGPIQLNFKDLTQGLESAGVTIGEKQESATLSIKTTLTDMEEPVNLTVVGTAKIGDTEIVRAAVPAEDRMQAFLWRHLLPAETLPVLVFDPAFKAPADRIRPPIRDEDRPKDAQRTLRKAEVDVYLRQIETLYQLWLLTDEFANREIAGVEARLIQ